MRLASTPVSRGTGQIGADEPREHEVIACPRALLGSSQERGVNRLAPLGAPIFRGFVPWLCCLWSSSTLGSHCQVALLE